MTQRRPEILIRLLLLLASLLTALALAEVGIRTFFPAGTGEDVTSGRYFPRFLMDGNPAASLKYYTSDPQLPFALKPGYRHTLVDLAWHPAPFRVTLDDFGYRNQNSPGSEYGLVVAGDSIAFGYGVNDDETISAHLGKLTKTYSLSIPGAGPEMYMVMIERFLMHAKTRHVAILYYEGNDYQNLRDAYWKELDTCSPAGKSKILRADTPFPPEDQAWGSSLSVVRLVKSFIRRDFGSRPSNPCELLGTYNQVSAAAITDLDNFESHERKLKGNMHTALSYLQQLVTAPCVGEAERRQIEDVIRSIRENATEHLASRMRIISASLAGKNCYPIGDGFPEKEANRNLAMYANYYAGFYYDYASSVRNGFDGNLRNFQALLDQMGTRQELRSEYNKINRLKEILTSRRDAKSAADISAALKAALHTLATTCTTPAGCDKENLFLEYLDSLRDRKIEVTLFTVPSENFLSSKEGNGLICRKASAKGIKCLDLYPRLAAHYQMPGANGLYLDGAHLTANGSAEVAAWMAAGLGLDAVGSGPH